MPLQTTTFPEFIVKTVKRESIRPEVYEEVQPSPLLFGG
jgi:hypothetical protein